MKCLNDPLVTEAMGMKLGTKFALELLQLRLDIEFDSLSGLNVLQQKKWASIYVGSILYECNIVEACFFSISFSHVYREGNEVAHRLAKFALSSPDQICGFRRILL